VIAKTGGGVADLVRRLEDGLSEQVRDFVRASRAASTLAAYRADWRRFEQWCREHGGTPLPATATTVAEYLAHLVARGSKVASSGICDIQPSSAASSAFGITRRKCT
jgi:hypothetical protein